MVFVDHKFMGKTALLNYLIKPLLIAIPMLGQTCETLRSKRETIVSLDIKDFVPFYK